MPAKEKSNIILSNLDFKMMSLIIKFRDMRRPRMEILKEVGIKPRFHVIDYGCGPGSYIVPLAELVGESGRIHALDANPLAIQSVKNTIFKRRLTNVDTILSSCRTELKPESIDVALLYDMLHDLENKDGVIAELHRVLKPNGILSVSDHHIKNEDLISRVTANNLFELSAKRKATVSFTKKI